MLSTNHHSAIRRRAIWLTLVLAACGDAGRVAYYDGVPPEITGYEGDALEPGNLGGHEVVILGSGFGSDPSQVVVQFGSQNAEIQSVSDTAISVLSPRGPIEGGEVVVRVATESGQTATSAGSGYTYDVGELYTGQVAYIQANNFWHSCLGGRDDLGVNQGCETFSYLGQTGLDGTAEFFNFEYRRKQSESYGWFGASDWAPGEWVVETPAYRPFAAAVDDLRQHVDDFSLCNPRVRGDCDEETEGPGWCADTRLLGSWYFGGTDELSPQTYSADGSALEPLRADNAEDCEALGYGRWYDMGVLQYCEVPQYQENHSNDYQADWMVGEPFFVPVGEGNNSDPQLNYASCRNGLDDDDDGDADGMDSDCHPIVQVQSSDTGLNGIRMRLPEPVRFQAQQGFEIDSGLEDIWALLPIETCFDDNADNNTDLDEVAFRISWEKSGFEPEDSSDDSRILASETHVRVSLTVLTIGWFGGEAQPFRTTITVPDDYNYDETTGQSYVDLPVGVIYQVPSVDLPNGIGTCSRSQLGVYTCTFGDPAVTDYGYLIITADRVTEYRLDSDKLAGDLVFSYVTGDFSFQSWDNPYEAGPCGDCLDNDGDGWMDDQDADCLRGQGDENGLVDGTEDFTCSDGIDNDDDGDIDSEDADCSSGIDRESNCGDGVDNDGDGWIDELDGECAEAEGQELGFDDPAWGCSNGLDDDGDGWIDASDPACENGADPEDDGFSGTVCNDGVDNDGHGDADALDPLCQSLGAGNASESPVYSSACTDGVDNETSPDLYVDYFDPDCEVSPYWRERTTSNNPDSQSYAPQCYDGLDNDADGVTDADDPGCWNNQPDLGWAWVPDGFLNNEGADDGSCSDGEDNDGDGLVDRDDTDSCQPGALTPDGLTVVGTGNSEFN